MVKKEFDLIQEDGTVFKLIGPVLVKQDLDEARTNVDKRIEFITNGIKDVETKLKELETAQEKKQAEVGFRVSSSKVSFQLPTNRIAFLGYEDHELAEADGIASTTRRELIASLWKEAGDWTWDT